MTHVKNMMLLVMSVCMVPGLVLALDDPTRPPGHSSSRGGGLQGPVWNISEIRIASKHKTAVINGRTVAIGHRVNGATVIDIEPSIVKFRKAGKEFSVRLFANSVKKIARVPEK